MSEQKPASLLDLKWACSSLSMLFSCSNEWIPEGEWEALADALRPRLRAAAGIIAEHADKNSELFKLFWENGMAEVARMELADLHHHLSGRSSIGPGNPMRLPQATTWRRPEIVASAERFPESSDVDE